MSAPTLMVIDDDPTTQTYVRDAMTDGSCVILSFESCDEGVAAAAEWPPDAIVLSADLAGGFGACRRLKKDLTTRDIPLVLVTAQATEAQLEEHHKLPTRADVYLRKPVDPAKLAVVLAELLSPQSAIEDVDVEVIALPSGDVVDVLDADEVSIDNSPLTDPERNLTGDRLAALTRSYADLLQDHSALTTRLQAATDAVARLEEEKAALASQLAGLTGVVEQTESANSATRARMEAFGAELERERAGREAQQAEVRRLKALNADLTESLEAIGESLRTSVEIVERYREHSGGRATESPHQVTSRFVALDEL